nr:DUF5681 domain-containing protein [Methyloceanibacter marginalis]
MSKAKRPGGPSKPRKTPTGDYPVGYCRPPEATQWKPGQSAHPAGRPRGSKNEDTIVREVINRRVALSLGGKVRKVSLLEAVWTKIADDALKGNAKAQALILNRSRLLEAAPGERVMREDDEKVLQSYLRQVAAEIKAAEEHS